MSRPRWRIVGATWELVLTPWGADDAPRGERLDAADAAHRLDALLAASPVRGLATLTLDGAARYVREHHGRVVTLRGGDARSVVREALARGVLTAWREDLRHVAASTSTLDDVITGVALTSQSVAKTWIEIELLGEDEKPIAGAAYSITLPDGAVREGRLDARGRAYFGDLDPGACEVRWPELDSGAVVDRSAVRAPTSGASASAIVTGGIRAPTAPSGSVDDEKTWVEIELLGEDDKPIADAAYWIRTPDGVVHEGLLDANGRAYFDELDPGSCEIRWPTLDHGAVALHDAHPAAQASAALGGVAIARALGRTAASRDDASEPKTWVEIELLGEDEKPIADAAYWIRTPDGVVHEGLLDANGCARFADLDPGACEVRWPTLDRGAVEAR